MPLLTTWRESIPDPTQAREAVVHAIANARADAARLDALPAAAAAVALGAAASDAARLAMLVEPAKAVDVTRAYDATLRRVLPTLEGCSPEALAGILSFVNVVDTLVPARAGEFPEASVERATVWLEALARGPRDPAQGPARTTLAYAALAAGRADLARALDPDPRLHVLAGALDTGETSSFHDFLEAFPKAEDIDYSELVFAARAFVVFVGRQAAGSTAKWLHKSIHGGPTAKTREMRATRATPAAPPAGLPPAILTRAQQLFPSEAELAIKPGPGPAPKFFWSNIVLQDIHGIHGGRAVTVSSRGEMWTLEVAPGMHARRFHSRLSANAIQEINRLVAMHDVRKIKTSERNGVTGEGRPTLTYVVEGTATVAAKWANDVHPDFDKLLRWLSDAGATLAAMTVPIAEGTWVGRFEPAPSQT